MTDPILFSLAVLALLATPGPTNTLLAASGAAFGFRRSLKLYPAEIGGYLISISALISVAGPIIARHPEAAIALKLAASLWLIFSAVSLWRQAGEGFRTDEVSISVRRVFVTTLLNPKALIFALSIFPPGPLGQIIPWLAGFSGLVLLVATGWIGMGSIIGRSAGLLATPRLIWRLAAMGLATFATIIAGSAIAAVY